MTNKTLDLKGVGCPHTYMKSKIAMEELKPGEVLEIIVDYLPAIESVPLSLEDDGHEIIEVDQISDTDWKIVVKKGE